MKDNKGRMKDRCPGEVTGDPKGFRWGRSPQAGGPGAVPEGGRHPPDPQPPYPRPLLPDLSPRRTPEGPPKDPPTRFPTGPSGTVYPTLTDLTDYALGVNRDAKVRWLGKRFKPPPTLTPQTAPPCPSPDGPWPQYRSGIWGLHAPRRPGMGGTALVLLPWWR